MALFFEPILSVMGVQEKLDGRHLLWRILCYKVQKHGMPLFTAAEIICELKPNCSE